MKLAALCCTFRRPHTLGQLIECFLRQDYPRELRELVILDDAGQYENQEGDGWRLVSIPARFRSLGEKRNACAALASSDAEGFLVADDDDIYLPHWFQATADALKEAEWSRPGLVLLEHGDSLKEHDTNGLYHGGWAFRKDAFYRVRGYGPHNNGEDQELAGRLNDSGVTVCDPCEQLEPFYIYRYDNCSYHLSYMDDAGYQGLGQHAIDNKATISVGWPSDYTALPVIRRFTFAPHVNPRDDKMPVELIGPVDAPGGNGPSNGMYALQKELRKRIDDGLDWLTIKPLPVSEGALPWFWNWADRRYAAWWDSEGLPFVQGPNMLFTNSATPRIDAEECALLDAANCQAMFCHSEWYRDLIAKHRGSANQSPIVLWPYPIYPWPGEPLPDEYDLLIYAKNGHRPQLLEHLAEVFPRHIQIHYGRYQREELFEGARRSRACAYLADDDHGPLALQEILLAGCPTVGVRTGASLVHDGITGAIVNRLPPGASCVENDQEKQLLAAYLEAISRAQSQSRDAVREAAAKFEATPKGANLRKVCEESCRATQARDGRIEVDDRPRRPLLRAIAQPLQLGEMHETVFLLSQHWKNHFNPKVVEAGGMATVGQLRRWINEPDPMGLPKDVQNVVILVYAQQTNRTFYEHGVPLKDDVSLTKLPDHLELRTWVGPPDEQWKRAVELAGSVFGLAPSKLLNASNVSKLAAELNQLTTTHQNACRVLCTSLNERLDKFGLDKEASARRKTANAVLTLVDRILSANGNDVIPVLAGANLETSDTAMGTSLKTAAELVERIDATNWSVFEDIAELADDHQQKATEIRKQVCEALAADEYATALSSTLKQAQAAAVRLLASVAKAKTNKTDPTVGTGTGVKEPPQLPPGTRVVSEGEREQLSSAEATEILSEITSKMEKGASRRLTINWRIDEDTTQQ